jgi:hypothetical protein
LTAKHTAALSFLVLLFLSSSLVVSAPDDNNLARKALEDSSFDWKLTESENIRVYYQTASFAEKHRAMLLRSVAQMIDEVLDYLGETAYDETLNVFYVNSRQEMEQIVGSPVTGLANWSANAIFVVCSPEWRSFEEHEFTHNITMGSWGSPHETSRWMIEGISIASDGWCREYTVDEIAYHYLVNDEFPPLRELLDDVRSLGEIRGGMYAGSVIGYIRNAYGAEALRKLWLDGFDAFAKSVDIDLNQLEASWREYLKSSVGLNAPVDIETINELGCG